MLRFYRSFLPRNPFPQSNQKTEFTRGFTKWHQNLYFPSQIRSKFTPTIFIIGFIPIFTFALGTWQVQRRAWKLNLIEQLNDQLHRDPLWLPNFVKCAKLLDFVLPT
jgi:surfeit locus 1 family protein